MARDQALISAASTRDSANNTDSASLANAVTSAEDSLVSALSAAADSLVNDVFSAQRSAVDSLTSAINSAVSFWAVNEGTNYANYVLEKVAAATGKVGATAQADLDLEQAIAEAGTRKHRADHAADSALKTSTTNADASFIGLVISNLASFEITVTGLIHGFNIAEAAAWKMYSNAESGAIKAWSHSMADYTETFVNARIAAAVTYQRVCEPPYGATGYIISRTLAESIVVKHPICRMPIDHLYCQLSYQGRFYKPITPLIGIQVGLESVIHAQEFPAATDLS